VTRRVRTAMGSAILNPWRPAPMLGSLQEPQPTPKTPAPAMSGPKMGQFGNIGPLPALIGAAVGTGTAWVGWTVGTEKKGFLSATGYVVGVVGALGAIGGGIAFLTSLTR
jgi:hypothetical protein